MNVKTPFFLSIASIACAIGSMLIFGITVATTTGTIHVVALFAPFILGAAAAFVLALISLILVSKQKKSGIRHGMLTAAKVLDIILLISCGTVIALLTLSLATGL